MSASALQLVRSLRDPATVPVSLAQQAAQEAAQELAADREDTIAMWVELGTRYLCTTPGEAPAWDPNDPTVVPGRTPSAPEE
jgi:hypothetical protein